MDFKKILELYHGCDRVYGPYTSGADGRRRVVLTGKNSKNKTTRLYAKVLLEAHIGRLLQDDETVDHIDGDPLNDAIENLQILSKVENSRKSALGSKSLVGYKQSEEHRRSGAKNGKALFTDEQVVFYRKAYADKKMTTSQIVEATGVSYKTVRNMLRRLSYVDVTDG